MARISALSPQRSEKKPEGSVCLFSMTIESDIHLTEKEAPENIAVFSSKDIKLSSPDF
jgi:hypothetical protein